MPRYFLGVDTGGTKSHALIADESGRAVGFAQGGTGNHESVGYDGLRKVLSSITERALASAGLRRDEIAGAGFGIAGCDWPSDEAPTREVIDSLGLSAPYEFVNDATVALLAGAPSGWGVSVIAGTGCNCRGRDLHGREGRVTGEGHRMGEHGGGGEMVAHGVQAVAMSWTRLGPETRLTELFMDYVGAADIVDLLEGICRQRYRLPAAAAPLVFQAAEDGDAVAIETVRWAGQELGCLAVGVIRQLSFEPLEFDVVLAGSLYKGGALLTDALRETVLAVAPGARFLRLTAPPVIGGVVLAMQQVGLSTVPLRDPLIETTAHVLNAVG
jgi:N-acetylglucosamine kinase-like BadF-type ATPase